MLAIPQGAHAKTLRYANQGELRSLDPYTLNETTTIAHLSHVYEGLTRRGKDMAIEPGLAERWETSPDGLRWRVFLRRGVRFHDGSPFGADDVVFSADRVRAQASNFQTRVPMDAEVRKIDDYTVDFLLKSPNPILNAEWDSWFIMSRTWSERHKAEQPTPASAQTPGYAALNTNGTGPFIIVSHEPATKTVFKVNPSWWDKPEHNLTEIVFTPIASSATRVAALLPG